MFVMDLLSCGVVFWQNPWQAAGLYSRRTVTLTTPAFPVFASGDDPFRGEGSAGSTGRLVASRSLELPYIAEFVLDSFQAAK